MTSDLEVFLKNIDQGYQNEHGSTWQESIDAMELGLIRRTEIKSLAHRLCVACHATGQSTRDAADLISTFLDSVEYGETPKTAVGELMYQFLRNC